MAEPNTPSAAPAPTPFPTREAGPGAINKDSLVAAANKDDTSMMALLRGEEKERGAQVDRVRTALDVLQKELKGAKREEKARVARAARELMDEYLPTVKAELQTKADANLQELEKKISNARAVAVDEERAATDMISAEGVQLEVREIQKDLSEGNWMTWGKYLGAAAIAGIGAKWVWDHTIGWLWSKAAGDEKNPGFMRRAAGWVVGLGAAGLGALGISRYGRVANALLELGGAAVEGAQEGWRATAGVTLQKILDLWGDCGRVAELKRRVERGEMTEEEYNEAWAEAMALDGFEMLWEGTALHLWRGEVHLVVEVTPKFWAAAFEALSKRDLASGKEVLKIYMDGFVSYAVTIGGITGLSEWCRTGRLSSALGAVALESAMWPVQILRQGALAVYYVCFRAGRVTVIDAALSPGFRLKQLTRSLAGWLPESISGNNSPEALKSLVDRWKWWKDQERSLHGSSADVVESLADKCKELEQSIFECLEAMRQNGTVDNALAASLRRLMREGTNVDEVIRVLNGMHDGSGIKVAGLMDNYMDAQRALREAAGNPALVGRAQQRVDSILDELHETIVLIKEKIAAGETIAGVDDVVKLVIDNGADKIALTRYLQSGKVADPTIDVAAGAAKAVTPPPLPKKGVDRPPLPSETPPAVPKGAPEPPPIPKGTPEPPPLPKQATPPPLPTAPAAPALTETAEQADEWAKALSTAQANVLAKNATPEAFTKVTDAMQQCRAMGMKPAEALELIKEPRVLFALTKTPAAKIPTLALAYSEHGVDGFRRVSTFVAGVGKELDDVARAAKFLDPDLLKTIAAADIAPEAFARIASNPALRKALAKSEDLVETMKGLIWWEHTLSVNGILNIGGFAVSAVMLGVDIYTYVEMRNRLATTISNLSKDLTKAGFQQVRGYIAPGDDMKGGQGAVFKHPKTGTVINMDNLTKSINDLSTEQFYRVGSGVASTAAAAAAIYAPALALGPVGLGILAIELSIQAGLTIREDRRNQDFLLDTPTSVLAIVGMSNTVGQSEKDVADDNSSWKFADFSLDRIGTGNWSEKEKATLRKKAFAIMFFQEVGKMTQDAPDIGREIMQDHDATTFLDEENGTFWNVDFEKIIKPYLTARMFQRSTDTNVRWSEFRDMKIDEGTFDWQNISPEDTRMILREAARLYAQHLREEKYLKQKQHIAALEKTQYEHPATSVADIETRAHDQLALAAARHNVDILGKQTIFGASLDSVPPNEKTAVQRYVESIRQNLDDRAAITGQEQIFDAKQLAGLGTTSIYRSGDTLDRMRTKDLFSAPNPVDPTKTIALTDASAIVSREQRQEKLSPELIQALISKGDGLYEKYKPFSKNRGWYAQLEHLQPVRDYSFEMQKYPVVAELPECKEFINSVKSITERYAWEAPMFGGEVSKERDIAFDGVMEKLNAAVRSLIDRRFHVSQVDRTKASKQTVSLPGGQWALSLGSSNRRTANNSVIWVEHEGSVQELRGVPNEDKRYPVPGGTLIARDIKTLTKGVETHDYDWLFERSTDEPGGKKLYCYAKFEGVEQPGITLDLPAKAPVKMQYVPPGGPTIVPLEPSTLDYEATMDIAYVDESGVEQHATGRFSTLLKHPAFQLMQTDNQQSDHDNDKWTYIKPRDGVRIASCRIDYKHAAKSVQYVYEQEAAKKNPKPLSVHPDAKTVRKTLQTDRAIVPEKSSEINGVALLTIAYRTKEGKTVEAKGTVAQILREHPIGWKGVMNTDPRTKEKAEWTEFVGKDGATLLSCQVDHANKPQSTLYTWSKNAPAPSPAQPPAKESFSERMKRRQEGNGDESTSATSL